MAIKGRPRLSPALRTRIVQIRASNEAHPPSLDAILDELATEGWDPLPSRGSVQNVVRTWRELPEEIRRKEFPFQWQRLENASIPWEASHWALQCLSAHYESALESATWAREIGEREYGVSNLKVPIIGSAFTNRWAKWCWLLHLAAPDLLPRDVLILATVPATEERIQDLLGKQMNIQDLGDWLALRPDLEIRRGVQDAWQRYWDAVDLGLVKHPIPKTLDEAVERFSQSATELITAGVFRLPNPPRSGLPSPVSFWLTLTGQTATSENTTERRDSEEANNARNTETTEQGNLDNHPGPAKRRKRQAAPAVAHHQGDKARGRKAPSRASEPD